MPSPRQWPKLVTTICDTAPTASRSNGRFLERRENRPREGRSPRAHIHDRRRCDAVTDLRACRADEEVTLAHDFLQKRSLSEVIAQPGRARENAEGRRRECSPHPRPERRAFSVAAPGARAQRSEIAGPRTAAIRRRDPARARAIPARGRPDRAQDHSAARRFGTRPRRLSFQSDPPKPNRRTCRRAAERRRHEADFDIARANAADRRRARRVRRIPRHEGSRRPGDAVDDRDVSGEEIRKLRQKKRRRKFLESCSFR